MAYTSRVFAAIRRIAADLDAAAWPPHPVTGHQPVVGAGANADSSEDMVDVVYRVEDSASSTWAAMSKARQDETFEVDVYIRCATLGAERAEAWDRLEQLADVVQGLYRDSATGQYTAPDFPGVSQLGGLTRVTPAMWAGDEGWSGEVIVTFRIEARI